MRAEGGGFAGEDVWHNDPCVLQVVIESSVCEGVEVRVRVV